MTAGLAAATIQELKGRMQPGVPISVDALAQESGLSTSSIYQFKRVQLAEGWISVNDDNHLILHQEQIPEEQRQKPATRQTVRKLTETEITDLMNQRTRLLEEVETAKTTVKEKTAALKSVQEDLRRGI